MVYSVEVLALIKQVGESDLTLCSGDMMINESIGEISQVSEYVKDLKSFKMIFCKTR